MVTKKIQKFFSQYKPISYSKGHILLRAGEQPTATYFIKSGQVRQYDISDQGTPAVVNLYKTDAFFSVGWVINNAPNNYFYETVTDSLICHAPPNEVYEFLKQNPDVTFDLLCRVFMGTEVLLRRMTYLMIGSARMRILFELLLDAKRFGINKSDGSCEIDMRISELATRTGLSRETTSRELTKLKQEGILAINGKIIIKDLNKFYDILNI